MERLRGLYLLVEGTDGAGTTTQKELLKQNLLDKKRRVIDVAEPGGTPIGEALRLIIKDGALRRSPKTNQNLFNICRRELAEQVIEPALNAGTDVVSDRNWFSTVAYQCFGEGLDIDEITQASRLALGKLFLPNFAVIIDVPVEVSEVRISHRGLDANDTFEQKGRAFFERVREGYMWVAQKYDIPIIDGTKFPSEINFEILGLLENQYQLI